MRKKLLFPALIACSMFTALVSCTKDVPADPTIVMRAKLSGTVFETPAGTAKSIMNGPSHPSGTIPFTGTGDWKGSSYTLRLQIADYKGKGMYRLNKKEATCLFGPTLDFASYESLPTSDSVYNTGTVTIVNDDGKLVSGYFDCKIYKTLEGKIVDSLEVTEGTFKTLWVKIQ